jgi:hypothetical protein
MLDANCYIFRHQGAILKEYTVYPYTTYDVCFSWTRSLRIAYCHRCLCAHTQYINNCELIPEEAHYSMVLLSLQYGHGLVNLCGLGLVNLCGLGVVNLCGLGLVNLCNLEF